MFDSLWPHGLYSPWNSPGQNTQVSRCSFLQGIFPTQELNPGLLHCRWILYQLSCQGSPINTGQIKGFPGGSSVKKSACNAGDLGSIPGLGRFPGEGNGNSLQYSCLEVPWIEEPGRLQSKGSQESTGQTGDNSSIRMIVIGYNPQNKNPWVHKYIFFLYRMSTDKHNNKQSK